jgi:hypothetical protein
VESLTEFERHVLDAFLVGDEPQLEILRTQAAVAAVSSREHSGVGVFIHFAIPDSAPRVSPERIILGDVNIDLADVPHGVTSLLFIASGRIDLLEFVTNSGSWPQRPQLLHLGYFREEAITPRHFSLVPVERRDPITLARALAGYKAPHAT